MNFTNKHTGLLQCDSKSELLFLRSDFFMCGYKEYVLLFAWETCFRLSLQNSWGKLYSFLNSPKRHLFTSSRGKCDSKQNMIAVEIHQHWELLGGFQIQFRKVLLHGDRGVWFSEMTISFCGSHWIWRKREETVEEKRHTWNLKVVIQYLIDYLTFSKHF